MCDSVNGLIGDWKSSRKVESNCRDCYLLDMETDRQARIGSKANHTIVYVIASLTSLTKDSSELSNIKASFELLSDQDSWIFHN